MTTPTTTSAETVTETGKVVVHVDNVTAGYLPGINILNGCSLTAHEGELIGIIGPNGAGKSTLFKLIAGKEQPDSGTIKVGQTLKIPS